MMDVRGQQIIVRNMIEMRLAKRFEDLKIYRRLLQTEITEYEWQAIDQAYQKYLSEQQKLALSWS